MIHDPMTEPHWSANRERIYRALERVVSEIRTPALRSEIQRYIDALMVRVDRPTQYTEEYVEDARHDLMLLSGYGPNMEPGTKTKTCEACAKIRGEG